MTEAPLGLPPEAEANTKHCPECNEHLPLSSFSLNRHGNPQPQCRPCRLAIERARYAAKKEAESGWKRAYRERQHREREARKTAKEFRRAEQEATAKPCGTCGEELLLSAFPDKGAGRRALDCRSCYAEQARERYYRKRGRSVPETRARTLTPEQLRETKERTAHLIALLNGRGAENERLTDQQGWEVAMTELRKLWLQSGDKECASCRESVPPEQMLPPEPANFYPNHCRPCAAAAYERHAAAVFGRLPRVRQLRTRDGELITLAELARRHREREASAHTARRR